MREKLGMERKWGPKKRGRQTPKVRPREETRREVELERGEMEESVREGGEESRGKERERGTGGSPRAVELLPGQVWGRI